MLRRSVLAAGLMAALMAPASAELAIDHFTGRTQGQDVVFSVTAHNPGDVSQQGPIILKLYSRPDPSKQWEELKTWNIENLDAGAGLAQSFTSSGAAAAARKGDYEAKLVVELPGKDKWDDYARLSISK